MGCHRQISRISKTGNFDMCGNLLRFVLEYIPWVNIMLRIPVNSHYRDISRSTLTLIPRSLGEAEADMS
jgi:hypothetical protein